MYTLSCKTSQAGCWVDVFQASLFNIIIQNTFVILNCASTELNKAKAISTKLHASRKVQHGVRKDYHGVRKVYHGVRKVYHGIRKVYHGVRKVLPWGSDPLRTNSISNPFFMASLKAEALKVHELELFKEKNRADIATKKLYVFGFYLTLNPQYSNSRVVEGLWKFSLYRYAFLQLFDFFKCKKNY